VGHLDQTIAWFEAQSTRTRKWHFGLRFTQIVLASLIPVSQVLANDTSARAIAALFGAGIAICQGWDSLHHYGDHYVSWRAAAQQLKRERFLYLVREGPYSRLSAEDGLHMLSDHAISLETAEAHQWQSNQPSEDKAAPTSSSPNK